MSDAALNGAVNVGTVYRLTEAELRSAGITAVEAILRLHGVDDLPKDNEALEEEILDEVDRALDRLGITQMIRMLLAETAEATVEDELSLREQMLLEEEVVSAS